MPEAHRRFHAAPPKTWRPHVTRWLSVAEDYCRYTGDKTRASGYDDPKCDLCGRALPLAAYRSFRAFFRIAVLALAAVSLAFSMLPFSLFCVCLIQTCIINKGTCLLLIITLPIHSTTLDLHSQNDFHLAQHSCLIARIRNCYG